MCRGIWLPHIDHALLENSSYGMVPQKPLINFSYAAIQS